MADFDTMEWHTLQMKFLLDIKKYEGNCKRREVKCMAVEPKCIPPKEIGVGFNRSIVNCENCYREENNIPSGTQPENDFAIHAEQDLICKHGDELDGAYVYVTHKPCITCLKLLVNCGVKKIFYLYEYPSDDFFYSKILKYNNVELTKIDL